MAIGNTYWTGKAVIGTGLVEDMIGPTNFNAKPPLISSDKGQCRSGKHE